MEEKYKEQEKHLKQVITNKDAMEKELEEWHTFLTTGAGARFGYNGSLVDTQGFPDSDVEIVLSVRQARNRIACLKNDIKAIMGSIETELHKLHAIGAEKKKQEQASQPAKEPTKIQTTTTPNQSLIPFALVDQVSSDSPAQLAGLQIDGFGSVSITPTNTKVGLEAVGQVVRDSENKPIKVTVLRGGENNVVELSLVPKRWSGNGLLGCHLVPYTK